MRLTNRTDIAIRTLMYLAIHEERIITIDEIVEKSLSHRSQVVSCVQTLRKNGYINSTVGRSGGISLAKKPDQIVISSIVRLIEPDFFLAECDEKACRPRCAIYESCRLKMVLHEALSCFFKHLDTVTLADIVSNRDELRHAIAQSRLPATQSSQIGAMGT